MTRKTFLLILVSFFLIVLIALLGKLFQHDDIYGNPLIFVNYSNSGYYEIHPDTILESLNQGETNVFTAASVEILNRDEPSYEEIRWSQSDYLKIANALSQEVWHEPLDLKKWKILSLDLTQSCDNDPRGFYEFRIVYFQNEGLASW